LIQEIEISSLDLRYERCRLRHHHTEKVLKSSICEHGILEPLVGVSPTESDHILLDGFKRLRCARSLGFTIVPYSSLDTDEPCGVVKILRISISKGLSILDQASLIDELRNVHNLSITEIARRLEKSSSWVSMRSGLIGEMSAVVKEKLFKGHFPVYSYMYTLRQFIRMKNVSRREVDDFVRAVSGKRLSHRDIERLSYGYFRGPQEFRSQINNGNIRWGLKELSDFPESQENYSEFERSMIRDLEITAKYMERLTYKSIDHRLKTKDFFAQAHLLAGSILNKLTIFSEAMKDFHDRSRNTKGCRHSPRQGGDHPGDQPPARH
jgi:hypothetical protein